MRSSLKLDPAKIVATAIALNTRISERFPEAGLRSISTDLVSLSQQAQVRADSLARAIWPLRAVVGIFFGLLLAIIWVLSSTVEISSDKLQLVDFVQTVESGVNDCLLIGAGLFFLFTWEIRIKRNRALTALHELRSLAHIIDMHQLTKDPERLGSHDRRTPSSPVQTLNEFELGRYLDYCSEMLSITGKIAAVYAEQLNDSVVLSAVNEIESLTNGLSRKVWQKIMIIHSKPS